MKTWQRQGAWWAMLAVLCLPVFSAAHLWGVDGSHGAVSHACCDHGQHGDPGPSDEPDGPGDCQVCKMARAASVGAAGEPFFIVIGTASQPGETVRALILNSRLRDVQTHQRAPPPHA